MAFSFDKDSGFGGFSVDKEGAFDLPGLSGGGALSPGGINKYVDASYSDFPSSSGDSFSRILEALSKANAFKSQSSEAARSSTLPQSNEGSFQKINDSFGIYTPPSRVKQTGGSSGSGLGSTIGGLAGTALSFIPGVGPIAGALLPKVGSTVGGLFG